jgi:MFS family permease
MLDILRRLAQSRASRTTALVFALNSVLFGNWFARIPAVQNGLGLSDGQLGLALLGLPLGSIVTLPIAGWLVARYGAGRVTWWATLGLCLAIPGPALAGGVPGLALALAVLGVFNGAQDVAMNAEAAAIESRAGVSMMSSFHAMFSLGGIVGAGLGSLAAGFGAGPLPHLALVGAVAALVTLWRRGTLGVQEPSRGGEGEAAPLFALPRGPLVGLALVCFACMLCEGAAADWSAVHLLNNLGATPLLAGLGYAFFAGGMTAGRLAGDAPRGGR